MKNVNLYRIATLLMVFIFISGMGLAQENTQKEKKEKTVTYKVVVDEDSDVITIDSMVIINSDSDIDEIMKEIEVQMHVHKDHMKEIHVELMAEMDEMEDHWTYHINESSEKVEKALATLQTELAKLEIEAGIREKLEEAMKVLEESELKNIAHVEKLFIGDDHPSFFSEDGELEVIIEGDSEAKVYFIDKDGEHVEHDFDVWIDKHGDVDIDHDAHDVNIWVEEDGKKKVIIRKSGDFSEEDEFHFSDTQNVGHNKRMIIEKRQGVGHYGMEMLMIQAADDEDFQKAIQAGLPLAEDQRLQEMDIKVTIDGDQDPIVSFRSEENAKMKVTYYDESFSKIKTTKLSEKDGFHTFTLDKIEIKENKVKYLLLEQNKKADLMKL